MLTLLLATFFLQCSSEMDTNAHFYEVQGSLGGVTEGVHSVEDVQEKLNSDISAVLGRSDSITVDVDELKSNMGIYSRGIIFHGYVTTSVADRAELVHLLQSVPTVTIVFVAPRESIPGGMKAVMSSQLDQKCADGSIQLPNSTCLCSPYVTGLQCTKVTCQNFGLLAGKRCACAPGYNSAYCENRGYRPAVESDIDMNTRSLLMVFSLRISMEEDFKAFRANLPAMAAGIAGPENEINNYIFWGFVFTDDNVMTYYVSYGEQLSNLSSIFDSLVFSTALRPQPLVQQVVAVQQFYSDTKAFSNVIFFADVGASDVTPPSDVFTLDTPEHQVISLSAIWRRKFTFVFSESPSQPLNTSGDEFDVFRRMAVATHGDLFVVNKTDVAKVMTEVLSNYHKMENVAVRYKFHCNSPALVDIPAKYSSSEDTKVLLTVDKNDGNPSTFTEPYLVDANGVRLTATLANKYYSFYVLPSTVSIIGVMAETPGLKCSLRAFVSSDSTMLVSYTDNANIDIGSGIRYKGIPQYATGLPIGFPATTTVQLQPLNSTDGFPLGNMSLAVNRSNESTYSYFFANHDDCTPGPFVQSFQLYDGKKLAVRVLPAYCALLVPPVWSSKNDVVRSIAAVTDGQCPQMNIDAIGDPRSHDFRQVVFAVENSAAMSHAATNLANVVSSMIKSIETPGYSSIRQYSLIEYDDTKVRILLSSFVWEEFVEQFVSAMKLVASNNANHINQSLALDVIHKAYEISFLSPVALYLFTSTALSVHSTADRKPISKQMQVNVFTVGNGTILPYSDLTFHQRETSGRNMPVTADGIANLTSLLASSLDETSLLMDEAAQDCTTLTVFDFYVEDSATLLVINVVGIDVHKANMVLIADPSNSGIKVSENTLYVDTNTITIAIDTTKITPFASTWSLIVKTTTGSCHVQARVVSPLTVIPGFTSTANSDYVADSPFSARGVDNSTYAVFRVSLPFFVVKSSKVGQSSVDEPWNESLSTVAVQPRDENTCAYQFITANFQMTSAALVKLQITGRTPANLYFQRTFYFSQLGNSTTACFDSTVNRFGECVCPVGRSGEYCDEPICENGGTRSMSICNCVPGYYGHMCQSSIFPSSSTSFPTTSTTTVAPEVTTNSAYAFYYLLFAICLANITLL